MYIVVSLVSAGRAKSGVTDTASSLTLAQWWELCMACAQSCVTHTVAHAAYMHSVGEVFIAQ